MEEQLYQIFLDTVAGLLPDLASDQQFQSICHVLQHRLRIQGYKGVRHYITQDLCRALSKAAPRSMHCFWQSINYAELDTATLSAKTIEIQRDVLTHQLSGSRDIEFGQ